MSYSIDKNSLLYKTLEFNEKYLLEVVVNQSQTKNLKTLQTQVLK